MRSVCGKMVRRSIGGASDIEIPYNETAVPIRCFVHALANVILREIGIKYYAEQSDKIVTGV